MTIKVYSIALCLIPGVGNILAKQLIAYFGSAEAVFKATKGKLMKVPGIGEVISNAILKKDTLTIAEIIYKEVEEQGATLIFYYEEEYPSLLKHIVDAPLYIYWKGKTKSNFTRSIAIVGTRQCTEYGKRMTEEIVEELIPYKPTIVSGFAYGIDIVAHKAAIKHNLPTIAVLGSGFNKIYPSQHKRYVPDLIKNGALVSEYELNADPDAPHFPARNRIVAGMTEAVIVVEAAKEGGALITAELANGYDREVYAVPGNIGNRYSEGCNQLIFQNKAAIYTHIKNIAQDLGWDVPTPSKKMKFREVGSLDLSESEHKIYHLLRDSGELQIDPLAWKSQLHINELASVLLTMELRGLVKVLPGKKYTLC